MNIHINYCRYSAKAINRIDCIDKTCKKNVFGASFFQEWYGWTTTCLNCGRQYANETMLQLDFARGIRRHNIESAKRTWRSLNKLTGEIVAE